MILTWLYQLVNLVNRNWNILWIFIKSFSPMQNLIIQIPWASTLFVFYVESTQIRLLFKKIEYLWKSFKKAFLKRQNFWQKRAKLRWKENATKYVSKKIDVCKNNRYVEKEQISNVQIRIGIRISNYIFTK